MTPAPIRAAWLPAPRINHAFATLAILALAPFVTGCATVGAARPWAEQATLAPGGASLGQAIVRTAKAPQTWAPIAAAALLQIDHLDARAARWAAAETPLFHSNASADDASDVFANAAVAAWGVSMLAVPSGTDAGAWMANKTKGGLLDVAAVIGAQGMSGVLKVTVDRKRPDGSDHKSFPSGHATRASVSGTLAERNLRAAYGDGAAARATGIGTFALAAACAWSRVEAGRHYPADVLAGYALGHLVGAIVNDAFVTPAAPVSVRVSLGPGKGGAIVATWGP